MKKFVTVILLHNLDPDEGLCNGTRLIIRTFSNRVIDSEMAIGVHKQKRVFFPRIVFASFESELPFVLRRRQFPIRLAYCITINKVQVLSLETVGLYLPSPEAIFSHGQLYVAMSRVKNPSGLKIMVCGTDATKSVSIKNVVYREIFDPHSQIEPMEDIDQICSLLNETFPSSQLIMTSPLLDTVTTAKRESVLSAADGKWKIIKLNKFNDNTLIPLEPTETRMDTECVFDCALRNPLGHSEILPNSSFNNFTIRMRLKLAQSFGIDCAFILPVREIHRIASNYYTSLQMQLNSYFGVYVSLCSVKPDGNCLRIPCTFSYNSRNQKYYDILKSKQIAKFVACHNYHFNVLDNPASLVTRNYRSMLNQFPSEKHGLLM